MMSGSGAQEMMRCLIVSQSHEFGGVEQQVLLLISFLKQKVDFVVATAYESAFTDKMRVLGVRHHVLPGLRMAGKVFDLPNPFHLARLAREESACVMHSHGTHASISARIASLITGIPVISTIHGDALHDYPSVKRSLYRIVDTVTSAISTYNIAVSCSVRHSLQKQGYAANRVDVIYGGVQSLEGGDCTRTGEESDQCRFAVVGRISPEKGVGVFLDAARKCSHGYGIGEAPEYKVVGSGPQLDDLRKKAEALGVHVEFTGFVTDMRSVYATVDVLVLPSLVPEGLPTVILEAFAHGIPVIASAVGGIPEAVVNGVTGLLVPPGDSGALARAMSQLAADGSLRNRLGLAGKDHVVAHFRPEDMASRYHDLYRAVVEGKGVERVET